MSHPWCSHKFSLVVVASVAYDVVWLLFMWLCVPVFVLVSHSYCAMVYPRLDKSFSQKHDIRRRSNGHVTVQFLAESTVFFFNSYHGCAGFVEPCAVEGMCPTKLDLIPLLARSPVFFYGRLEMRRRQAKTLQWQLVELRERRASSEAVDVRAQHEQLRADVECESGT